MQLLGAVFAAPVGTVGLWAGGNDFGGHGAVTTYMAEPEPLGCLLRLAFTLTGAAAMTVGAVMFAATAPAVFALVR